MKSYLRPAFVSILTLSAVAFCSHAKAADFVDTFSDTDNLESTFGDPIVSVSAGNLTLTRTQSGVDTGLNWRPNSSGLFSIAEFPSFSLTASSAVNGGFYFVTALFFDGAGNFLQQTDLQTDTNALGTFTYDLSSVGGSAEQWVAQIRINPFAYTGADPAFVFSEFSAVSASAVPEPASYAVLVGVFSLGVVTLNRRRFRASKTA